MDVRAHDANAAEQAVAGLGEMIDAGLTEMAKRWDALAPLEREAALRRLADTAPRVLQLLCPDWGRFGHRASPPSPPPVAR